MFGYNGKILRVNLATQQFSVTEPPEDYYGHYLGGRGFITHTLLTEVNMTEPTRGLGTVTTLPGGIKGIETKFWMAELFGIDINYGKRFKHNASF